MYTVEAFAVKNNTFQCENDRENGMRVGAIVIALLALAVRLSADVLDVDGFRKPCDFVCHHGACIYEDCTEPECPGGGCSFKKSISPSCAGGGCTFDTCQGATCSGGR